MPEENINQNNKKETFKLHIGPEINHQEKPKLEKFHKKLPEDEAPKKAPVKGEKLWSTVRFISTSATIFIVLFFVMNWNAYSTIIMNKLGFIKPASEYTDGSDYSEEHPVQTVKLPVHGDPGQEQDLMALSKDPEVQKTQIPDLDLDVTPPDTRIIIPRINKNVPIVTVSTEALINRDWTRLEQEIQSALQDGVVHYPGTGFPGDEGNIVVTGHSSYFPWDPGRFKDVFALLHDVNIGDKIYVYHKQEKYEYEVYETKVVLPTQVDVLTQAGDERLTLITCTPVGTNLKRLVVLARPI
ncbi:sortase [Patescibacteria group bacterium]